MTASNVFYFAHLTDIHIGTNPNEPGAATNLKWALSELEGFDPKPEVIIASGDIVCNGLRSELMEYSQIMKRTSIPHYALAANHDLWGEKDDSAFMELIGPLRQHVVVNGLHFLLWSFKRTPDGWRVAMNDEDREWFEAELAATNGAPTIVAQHNAPPPAFRDREGCTYGAWSCEDVAEFIAVLSRHNVLAIISGDYHRNNQWNRNGIQIINSGALVGSMWNGHHNFPLKPGYRLFRFDGKDLKTFWRDGSFWQHPPQDDRVQKQCMGLDLFSFRQEGSQWWRCPHYERVQVTLDTVGGASTNGPRPLVRPVMLFDRAELVAKTFSHDVEIESVEWSLVHKEWHPMKMGFNGLWTEWHAEIDPADFRCNGEHVCFVRAKGTGGELAYDNVPFILCQGETAVPGRSVAQGTRDRLFDFMYRPE